MRTLKIARTEKGLSQQDLARMTRINQGTISSLEREVVSPTINQRTLLEEALGPLEWPQNREFSDIEKTELVQAFAALVNRQGPKQAVSLLANCKTLDELRGVASLFAPPTHFVDALPMTNHGRNNE